MNKSDKNSNDNSKAPVPPGAPKRTPVKPPTNEPKEPAIKEPGKKEKTRVRQ